jgi:integrase
VAEIFRPTYQTRSGETKQSRKWYARIGGKRVPLGTTDKRIAQTKANDIERATQLGYDPQRHAKARNQPILGHLIAYEDSLRAKGRAPTHVGIVGGRLRKLVTGVGIKTLADISTTAIENWLAGRQKTTPDGKRGMSNQTRKHYAVTLNAWGRWLVAADLAARNPFAGVRRNLNTDADRRRRRRALTADEAARLVAAAGASRRKIGGMSGPDRRLFYLVALTTGYRKSELGSLEPESFQLDHDPPIVVLSGDRTKNGAEAMQPVPPTVADELRTWLATKPAGQVLFPVAGKKRKAMLNHDLRAADVEPVVDGKTVDIHALRVSYITSLVVAGTPLPMAQKLARHSDPRLTSNVYTSATLGDLGRYVAALPVVGRRAVAREEGNGGAIGP